MSFGCSSVVQVCSSHSSRFHLCLERPTCSRDAHIQLVILWSCPSYHHLFNQNQLNLPYVLRLKWQRIEVFDMRVLGTLAWNRPLSDQLHSVVDCLYQWLNLSCLAVSVPSSVCSDSELSQITCFGQCNSSKCDSSKGLKKALTHSCCFSVHSVPLPLP